RPSGSISGSRPAPPATWVSPAWTNKHFWNTSARDDRARPVREALESGKPARPAPPAGPSSRGFQFSRFPRPGVRPGKAWTLKSLVNLLKRGEPGCRHKGAEPANPTPHGRNREVLARGKEPRKTQAVGFPSGKACGIAAAALGRCLSQWRTTRECCVFIGSVG